MSDGRCDRASIAMEVCNSSHIWSVQPSAEGELQYSVSITTASIDGCLAPVVDLRLSRRLSFSRRLHVADKKPNETQDQRPRDLRALHNNKKARWETLSAWTSRCLAVRC